MIQRGGHHCLSLIASIPFSDACCSGSVCLTTDRYSKFLLQRRVTFSRRCTHSVLFKPMRGLSPHAELLLCVYRKDNHERNLDCQWHRNRRTSSSTSCNAQNLPPRSVRLHRHDRRDRLFTGRWLFINGMAHRVWRTCRGLNRSWSEPLKERRRK